MVKSLLSEVAGYIYGLPLIGLRFRKLVESCLGERFYQSRGYWNESLGGWASSYLGNTLTVDLRNTITILLARRLAPTATSLLDVGCAGGTLALCLGPEFRSYCGVDISDVAIAKAKECVGRNRNSTVEHNLQVARVQDFQSSRRFDIIVFNEVLYYISLDEVAAAVRRYRDFLSPQGLVLVSLKEDHVSRLVQKVILRELKFEYGVLYQQKPALSGWKTTRNRETPAHLVQAFRAIR